MLSCVYWLVGEDLRKALSENDAPAIPDDVKPVVVASHRRSGTHLMLDLLRRQFSDCRPPFRFGVNPHRYLYFELDRLKTSHRSPAPVQECLDVLATMRRPPIKTHALPGFAGFSGEVQPICVSLIRQGVVIYCARDVRAVLASYRSYHSLDNPLARVQLGEFIRQEVDGKPRPKIWADHVIAWLDACPQATVVRYEDVVQDPDAIVEKLSHVLGVQSENIQPILPPRLRHRSMFWLSRLIGIPQSTNIIGRNGCVKHVDWRTGYTDADLAFLDEHAGDAMRRLGYLQGDEWPRS